MEGGPTERLKAELELLTAIYPDEISFSPQARELRYSHSNGGDTAESKTTASLVLRLPDTYPTAGFPDVISATDLRKQDLRSATVATLSELKAEGEEVLDSVILAFQELLVSVSVQQPREDAGMESRVSPTANKNPSTKTVVIWLHHLLNTSKRKLALHPSLAHSKIAGVTKPGYPGVLVFSGDKETVDAHVAELRGQKWQAFQVRYDSDHGQDEEREWQFSHGSDIREVDSMSAVAQSILNEQQRETFLNSIGVK
ncbi:hypothetical protein F5Y15DRAFT_160328 [Xylariaceae sp. FL0016]|nr:hypothetical protein F5Y15DRAFT_160328 [Xylariaceae sp. FL0016]